VPYVRFVIVPISLHSAIRCASPWCLPAIDPEPQQGFRSLARWCQIFWRSGPGWHSILAWHSILQRVAYLLGHAFPGLACYATPYRTPLWYLPTLQFQTLINKLPVVTTNTVRRTLSHRTRSVCWPPSGLHHTITRYSLPLHTYRSLANSAALARRMVGKGLSGYRSIPVDLPQMPGP
jgi:hypothetical protein